MEKFSDAVSEALEKAFELARDSKHSYVTENHLLKNLLQNPSSLFCLVIKDMHGNLNLLMSAVDDALHREPTVVEGSITPKISPPEAQYKDPENVKQKT